MPLINIYFKRGEEVQKLQTLVPELKKFLAKKLTCEDITLTPEEISIRLLDVKGGEMIATIEIEIVAHAFPERVKNQDEICLDVMDFFKQKSGIGDVKVWLKLSELGHSW